MNAQLLTTATGKYVTTCRICQRAIAESAPIESRIIGERKKREKALVQKMYDHLVARHNTEFQKGLELSNMMTELAKEYKPFLILSAFDCQDPSVSQRLENIRAAIFMSVRKNTMADPMIEHIVASMGLDPEDATNVNQAMKSLRDVCCEFGQYAPKDAEESRIIPV